MPGGDVSNKLGVAELTPKRLETVVVPRSIPKQRIHPAGKQTGESRTVNPRQPDERNGARPDPKDRRREDRVREIRRLIRENRYPLADVLPVALSRLLNDSAE